MKQKDIFLRSRKRGFHLITHEILDKLDQLPQTGILHLFIKHTSAGLTINENADPDVSPKEALKLWKDYFKEYGKLKRNKKAKEYYSTGVKINQIYEVSKIDVFNRFEERGNSTIMTIWVDLGMAFVTSSDYPSEYRGVVQVLEEFSLQTKEYVVGKEMKDAEEDLVKFEKKLEKLEKSNLKLHEKISDYHEKIVEAEGNIEENKKEKLKTKMDIDNQISVLKEIQFKLESIRKESF